MRTFYTLSKLILHKKIKDIDGKTYEKYYKDAEEFVNAIKKIVEAQKEWNLFQDYFFDFFNCNKIMIFCYQKKIMFVHLACNEEIC